MRTSLLLATFVASVVLSGGIAHSQGQPGRPQAAARGTNVAVIDIGYIFKNASRFKQSMDQIKAQDEAFQKEMEQRRDALTAGIQNLQTMPKGTTDYKILEERIAGDQTKLRLDMARNQKERIEQEAKVYFHAYREIEDRIKVFATKYGIDIVIRFNREEMDPSQPESVLNGINRFVVYHGDLDITGAILDDMNRSTPPVGAGGTQATVPNFPPRR